MPSTSTDHLLLVMCRLGCTSDDVSWWGKHRASSRASQSALGHHSLPPRPSALEPCLGNTGGSHVISLGYSSTRIFVKVGVLLNKLVVAICGSSVPWDVIFRSGWVQTGLGVKCWNDRLFYSLKSFPFYTCNLTAQFPVEPTS